MRLPDRLWVPAAAAGLLALVFAAALLVRAHGDASLLVHAGAPCTTVEAVAPTTACAADADGAVHDGDQVEGAPGSLTVQPADRAFDGQFFYRLGVAPWSTHGRVAGVQFDLPALRNARWGYGALAFVASGGDRDLVPWSLLAMNVAAAAAIGAIGGGLARTAGRHAAWGAAFALWPGFAYSLSLDTSELVASAFVLGGILLLRHRRWPLAGLVFTAAVLTRDTTAVVPFGVLLAGGWTWWQGRGDPDADRDRWVGMFLAGWIPLLDFGIWQLVQRARFGAIPLTSSGDNNLQLPLRGLAHELGQLATPQGGDDAFRLLCIAGLAALFGAAGWTWRRSSAPIAERVAWLPAVAVVLLLNAYLWSGATAFLRAATEAGLLSILVIFGCGRERLIRLTVVGLGGLWLLTAASQVAKLA